jgi:hypothetical protein
MCKVDNRGSATVELCLIMPVILLIIVMIIKLYMGLIYEGNVCGRSYSELYLYDMSEDGGISGSDSGLDSRLEEISDSLLADEDDRCSLSAAYSDGYISISSASESGDVTYRTEYGKCSSRLRRWQLYGDIIQ